MGSNILTYICLAIFGGFVLYLCISSIYEHYCARKARQHEAQVRAKKHAAECQWLKNTRQEESSTQQFDETRKAEFLKQLAEMNEQYAFKERERKRREEEEEKRKANQFVYLTDEQREKLEQGIELPRLKDCELMLQRGEIVVFGSRAAW